MSHQPAFFLKMKDADDVLSILGAFRLVDDVSNLVAITGHGHFINAEVANEMREHAEKHQPLDLVLSFDDGRNQSGRFLITSLKAIAQTIAGPTFEIKMVQVITLDTSCGISIPFDTSTNFITFTYPLHDALDAGLPLIKKAIEEYDQLLACGDCGNTYCEETQREINEVYNAIAAIEEQLEKEKMRR